MYSWWVFLHIAGVFGFLTAHGVSIGVAFKLRRERDPQRILALNELSSSSISLFYVSLGVLLLGGIVAGFMGRWWGQAWIWVSLGLLIATSIAMYAIAHPYYRRVGFVARAMAGGSTAVTEEQLDEILLSPVPWVLAAIGFGAILFILFLMIFKPWSPASLL
ncbi:MAG TPA: hypothetical protein VHI54_01180 [Actinomycetota bacterium]|nr:hypothetical protein [Actinomycetota bacterium]